MSDTFNNIILNSPLSDKERYLWHFMLKISGQGFWHRDFETDTLSWSESLLNLLGLTPDDFSSNLHEFYDRLHPQDLDRVKQLMQECVGTRNIFSAEYRIKHSAGHYLHIQASGQAMHDNEGTPIAMVGSMTDVTESVRLREALKQSKDELRLIFDNVPVRIWYKDDENHILRLNKVAADSMNMKVEDAEGADTYDLFPELAKKYHEDDLKVINSGKPALGIVEEYTPLEGTRGWVRTDKIPYTNPETGERAVFVASLDVTQEKETELSLKNNIERFELAVAGASVGIWDWVMEPEETLWWSPRLYSLLDLEPDELEPSLDVFTNLIHPAERDSVSAAMFNHIEKREPYTIEFRMQCASGNYKWFLATGQAQWNNEGTPTRMVGSLMDIDELKNMQISLEDRSRKLEAMNADLEQFAYVASHDLKAPLRGLDNLAQWITDDLGDDVDEDIKEKLDLMRGRVGRMEALLTDILAYSRAGSQESPPERLNLNTMIGEILEWLDPPSDFKIEIEDELPELVASRTIMEHVFLNLLSNAIKHHDRIDGHVKISCKTRENMFEFSIKDDGGGIAPEHHEQIFQMFTTLKARDKVEGSGVGLAIVKKMLKSVGQDIWVESPGELGGTDFLFTMPKA